MNDRFTPRSTLTPERLEAYIQGRLSPAEQHDVELLLEESPLHAAAVDGLRTLPDPSFARLHARRPRAGRGLSPWIAGAGVLLVAGALVAILNGTEEDPPRTTAPDEREVPLVMAPPAPVQPVPLAEITAATELPESLQIGHAVAAVASTVERDTSLGTAAPVTLQSRPVQPATDVVAPQLAPVPHVSRGSRPLVYLRGFKLVDPEDLHAGDPSLEVGINGTPADLDGHDDAQRRSTEEHTMPYLAYFDHALLLFDQGRHKAALSELQTVLAQYPDDLNALFYSGLCCYNLGLFQRAKSLFLATSHHPVGTFNEEALWYHALAVEQEDGPDAADPLFERIAAQGGFYAARAKARMGIAK